MVSGLCREGAANCLSVITSVKELEQDYISTTDGYNETLWIE